MSSVQEEQFEVYSKKRRKKPLREKVFVLQQSYFTTLFEDDNFKSIYYFGVSIFIIMLLDTITSDLLIFGKVYLGLRNLKIAFGKFDIAITQWALMHMPIIGLYYAFHIWIRAFRSLKSRIYLQTFWNSISIMVFVGFQTYLLHIASSTCVIHDLPFATGIALLMETLRLMMKTHAFIRTIIPKILMNDDVEIAPVNAYIYYLFAPTFIYRDSYPRTNNIHWTFAITNLIDFVLSIFFSIFLFERYILPIIKTFGLYQITFVDLFKGYFSLIMPSTFLFLCFHRMIFHSWLNFTGEILCFGDRMYYRDWWTSTNYRNYYSSWNTVVHDWLYEYIYKDCHKYIFRHSFNCCSLMVFYLSAFFHEFICCITLKMIYPLSFLMFGGMGVIFFFYPRNLSKRIGNVFVLLTLQIGFTLMIYLYGLEYYARKNITKLNQMSFTEQLFHYPVSWKIIGRIKS